jgi:hypothetical protein
MLRLLFADERFIDHTGTHQRSFLKMCEHVTALKALDIRSESVQFLPKVAGALRTFLEPVLHLLPRDLLVRSVQAVHGERDLHVHVVFRDAAFPNHFCAVQNIAACDVAERLRSAADGSAKPPELSSPRAPLDAGSQGSNSPVGWAAGS